MLIRTFDRSRRRNLRPVTLILWLGVCAVIAAIGLSAKARFSGAPASSPRQEVARSQAQERIEAELITIRRFGFEPAEIRRPAGEFVLVIDDRSQKPYDLALTLSNFQDDRPTNKLRDVDFKRGLSNWHDRFNLPAGDYVLTEANHPQWRCKITITSR